MGVGGQRHSPATLLPLKIRYPVFLKSVLKLIRKNQKYINFLLFSVPSLFQSASSSVLWSGRSNTLLIPTPVYLKWRLFAKQLYKFGCIKQTIWRVHDLQEEAAASDVTYFTSDDEFDSKNKWQFFVYLLRIYYFSSHILMQNQLWK